MTTTPNTETNGNHDNNADANVRMTAATPANDNTKLQVVWEDSETGRKRNYTMYRCVTHIDPNPSGVTGDVDFGRQGLWRGYAVLDEKTNKFVFHRSYELLKTADSLNKDTKTG
jgi:hypothetical protein